MVDIHVTLFNKSLKTNWIKTYLDDSNHGKWKEFLEFELDGMTENQFSLVI